MSRRPPGDEPDPSPRPTASGRPRGQLGPISSTPRWTPPEPIPVPPRVATARRRPAESPPIAERDPGRTGAGAGGRDGRVPRTSTATRAVAGIAAVSAGWTLLSRLTGLLRTVLQGTTLGVNAVGDAYNLANTTPNIIYDLIAGGVLAGTLVPVFVQALREDGDGAWEGISAVCTAAMALLTAVTVLFGLLGPWVMRFYELTNHTAASGAERSLATSLLYLLVPEVVFYGATTLITAILIARESYYAQLYTPILNNLLVIGVLIATASLIGHHPTPASVHHDHGLVLLLGLGTTAGIVAMTLGLLPALRRSGARLRWVWNPRHPMIRRILRLAGWTAGVVVANQVAYIVVILIANHRPGDYTAYTYAYQFFLLPHSIWIVSLLAPMERGVAHDWQSGDREGARRSLVEAMWLGMVFIVPAALGYMVLAHPAIDLVLLHGNVTPAEARTTASVLIAFAVGLPTFGMYFIVMRAFQAVQDTRAMFVTYVVENGLNIVIALAVYHRFGITGVAAAWSAAYALAGFGALAVLVHRVGGIHGRQLAIAAGMVVIAAVAAAGTAWGISSGLAHLPGGTRQVGVALRIVIAAVAGGTVYLLAARALGFEEVRSMLQLRRRSV